MIRRISAFSDRLLIFAKVMHLPRDLFWRELRSVNGQVPAVCSGLGLGGRVVVAVNIYHGKDAPYGEPAIDFGEKRSKSRVYVYVILC